MKITSAAILTIITGSAVAAEPWYAFVDFGSAKSTIASPTSPAPAFGSFTQTTFRSTDSGGLFAAGGGYRFTERWAIEASIVNIEDIRTEGRTLSATSPTRSATTARGWTSTGASLSAMWTQPLAPAFAFHVSGTAYVLTTKSTENTQLVTTPLPPAPPTVEAARHEESATSLIPALGIGLTFTPAPNFILRAYYERWLGKADYGSGELEDIRALRFGAAISF